jgi:penicillin-binding protein 1A
VYKKNQIDQAPIAKIEKIKLIDKLLSDVIRTGTGKKATIQRYAAGKTGTSQRYRDAWFIGYSGDLIVGVWFGRDDANSMDEVTGGGLAAKVWSTFMEKAVVEEF